MKKISLVCLGLISLLTISTETFAQRQVMDLGRGVVAVYRDSKVTVDWRRLVQDQENATYNVYVDRSGGSNFTKVNASPLSVTNYQTTESVIPSGSSISVTVVDSLGNEGAKSLPFIYHNTGWPNVAFKVNFKDAGSPLTTSSDFNPKFCWPVDLDGDGEMEYVVGRMYGSKDQNGYEGWGTDKLGGDCIEAYTRQGEHLWTVNLGLHFFAFGGQNDGVSVGDFDGDGKGEVMVQVCEGARFWDSANKTWGKYLYYNGVQASHTGSGTETVTSDGSSADIDADGVTNYTYYSKGKNPQWYMAVIDGMTGAQKDVCPMTLPKDNDMSYTRINKSAFMNDEYPYISAAMGAAFLDGVHQSAVAQFQCRTQDGTHHYFTYAYGYNEGNFGELFTFAFHENGNPSEFHHIRIGDIDGDGKDEVLNGAYCLDNDGKVKWNSGIGHGDRFRLSDIDPDRPGQEVFAIQQNAGDMLGMILYSATDGSSIKRWYMGAVGDVGRGECMDVDPSHKGYEMWSTMANTYDAKGDMISSTHPYPFEGLWWDGDLARESCIETGSTDHNLSVGKWVLDSDGWSRLFDISKSCSWQVHGENAGRPLFWGDILGDWREEVIMKTNDSNGYWDGFACFSTNYTTQEKRIYCLLQDPNYFGQTTNRGYYQSPCTGFYLGYDMPRPQLPPVIKADSKTALYDLTKGTAVVSAPDAGVTNAYYMPVDGQTLTVNADVDTESMTMWKGGQGTLVLNGNVTPDIVLTEGTVEVNGKAQKVDLRARGVLAGTGTVESVALEGALNYAEGVIRPTKTLTVSGDLVVDKPLYVDVDLDKQTLLKVGGNLNVKDELTFNISAGKFTEGEYNLLQYGGTFSGSTGNCAVRGIVGYAYELINGDGMIKLKINGTRLAENNVEWTGEENTEWNYSSKNWSIGSQTSTYVTGDTVVFNDKTTKTKVAVPELVTPGQVVVDATQTFTFTGNGGISGGCSLVKNGAGTLVLDCKNSDYTGATIINEGIVELKELSMQGTASSIGAGTTSPSSWQVGNAKMIFNGASLATDRGIQLKDTASFEIPSACSTTLKGYVMGSGILKKTGAGQLSVSYSAANAWKSTILENGVLAQGTYNTTFGTASSLIHVTGNSQITQFYTTSSSNSPAFANALQIDSAKVLTFVGSGRGKFQSKLTGKGTIKLSSAYVRFDSYLSNASAFEGTYSIGSGAGRFAEAINMPLGTLDIQSGVSADGVSAGGSAVKSFANKIGCLTGSGNLGSGTWTIGREGGVSTFAGTISSDVTLKDGFFELQGSSSGVITVNGGELFINNGKNTLTGNIIANSGALVDGRDSVNNVTINKGATVGSGSLASTYLTRLMMSNSYCLKVAGTLNVSLGNVRVRYTQSGNDKIINLGEVKLSSPTFVFTPVTDDAVLEGERSFLVFSDAGKLNVDGTVSFLPEKPCEGYLWDASKLSTEGIISIVPDPTGISNVSMDDADAGAVYDIAGRRVKESARGILITRNRKVVKK